MKFWVKFGVDDSDVIILEIDVPVEGDEFRFDKVNVMNVAVAKDLDPDVVRFVFDVGKTLVEEVNMDELASE